MLGSLLAALYAVVPVFLVIGLGALMRRQEILPDNAGRVLGLYVLKVALPLLVLHLFAQARPEDLVRGDFWLGLFGAQALMFIMVWGVDRLIWHRGPRHAIVSGMNCSVCNMAFVGLPLVMNVFHGDSEALLVAGLIVVLSPNIAIILVQLRLDWLRGVEGSSISVLRKLVLENPLLLAALVGGALAATRWGLWEPLDRAASLVGYTAAPCMLLSLGLDLRQKLEMVGRQVSWESAMRQAWLISCKLLVHPILCWLCLWLLGVEGLWLSVSVLLCATAAALVNALIAEVYDAGAAESALTVVLSNALSMFTLTGFIWLFFCLDMV